MSRAMNVLLIIVAVIVSGGPAFAFTCGSRPTIPTSFTPTP